MATVLFFPVTFNLAETTRMIEVARSLDPAHRAVFMGYEEDFAGLVTDAGFEYVSSVPVFSAEDRERLIAFDQGRALTQPFTEDLVMTRVTHERRLIRQLRASAVVTGSSLTAYISARAEDVPLFYPVPFAMTDPQVKQAARMHLVDGDGAVRAGLDRIATAAFAALYTRAPLMPRAFARVAARVGAPVRRSVSEFIDADVNLLTEMEWELEGFELPANFRRVGPIFARIEAPLPAIVEELAAGPKPLVYLGLGSSANRGLALDAAHALGTLPVEVVAPIRQYLDPSDTLPDNVHLVDLVPAHRLGGLVDAAVLHGGQGTVQTSCATGIPFIGMGLSPEQTWHTRLCEKRGNAIALSPGQVGTPAFLDAVRAVLDDPAIRTAAREVAEDYAQEDGAHASARIIESYL